MITEISAKQPSTVQAGRLGWWLADGAPPQTGLEALRRAIHNVGRPVYLVDRAGELAAVMSGTAQIGLAVAGPDRAASDGLPLTAFAPAIRPEDLGDAEFRETHGLRYAYIAGAMANGIASERLVEAMGKAGMIGFFGAAGLPIDRIDAAIQHVRAALGDRPFGFNLIHSPYDPQLESATVDLYLERGVHLASASAYLDLTLPLVCYRTAGIHRAKDGRIVAPNRVIAKVSRTEVAAKFFSPPPDAMLRELVATGKLTAEQGELAAKIPVAQDLTAEADSGGHTDNRPAISLLPTMTALRDQMQERFQYASRLRVGAAGGIATPASAAAAFAMGAAYVLTGSINQACVEAGTSPAVRQMLAEASQADVTMAPAADMFEMGVKVQVLKWGTMFAVRARKLYELYRAYNRLEEIPAATRAALERDYFRKPIDEVWAETVRFFEQRDPGQIVRAQRDAKHKMALVFRWYLGQSSNWANAGEPTRKADYQIWCGPAMGAFNEWARGSLLVKPENREAATVAMNLLVGAAALTRAAWLRGQGVPLDSATERFSPRPLSELRALVDGLPEGEAL